MAKYTPGPTVGSISGSIGGTTYTHNRYGPVMRTRAVPTNPNTEYQQSIRGLLASTSQAFQGLTDAQRAAWTTWAQTHPITDRLGQSQIVTGHIAYIRLNVRLAQAGDSAISEPPAAAPPTGLTSLTLTADLVTAGWAIAFTATPLGDDDRLVVLAAVVTSASINYVDNLLKQVTISDKAQATDLDNLSDIEDRFGTLQVDQKVVILAHVLDSTTGLISGSLRNDQIVVDTTV